MDQSAGDWRHASNPFQHEPLQRLTRGGLRARVMHSPASESIDAGAPSQDYLFLTERGARVAFAVADGVSSSFFAEIAAKELATGLAQWLTDVALLDEISLKTSLNHFLSDLAVQVQRQVEVFEVPPTVVGFVRQELERRREYGSEAMVACGVIERFGPSPRLAVAWLGDAHLRIWSRDGTVLDLEGSVDDRWSTTRGTRGSVNVWMSPAARVCRLLACTDGVSFALDAVASLPDDRLRAELQVIADAPSSDDIAFLDIGLNATALPPQRSRRRAFESSSIADGVRKLRERVQHSAASLGKLFGAGDSQGW